MKYTYDFKLECVSLYRQKKWHSLAKYNSTLKQQIRLWNKLERIHGPEGLKPKRTKPRFSQDYKFTLVKRVLEGHALLDVALEVNLPVSTIFSWVRKYKEFGYNGLENKNTLKNEAKEMKKLNINNPRKRNETEHEELLRLRAENAYIKAEIAVIKKEIALREQKEVARLKAKKRPSSKNYWQKDMN